MTEEQARQLRMYMAVQAFLTKNKDITIGFPRFDNYFTPFCDVVREIRRVARLRDAFAAGIGETKLRLRKLLAEQGADIARRVEAYAIVNNSSELMNAVHYSEADIERCADYKLPEYIRNIIGACIPILRQLAPYGIEKNTLDDLEQILFDFNAISPFLGKKEKDQNLPELDKLFATANVCLARIDGLLAIFHVTESAFFTNYNNCRTVEMSKVEK